MSPSPCRTYSFSSCRSPSMCRLARDSRLRHCLSCALPLERALRYLHVFLSSRFSSPGDAAYASRPVIDAPTIRDKKIKRLWLHAERANQHPRNAEQFAAIACSLHSISALMLPLKEYLPQRCLALPKIFPNVSPNPLCGLVSRP